MSRVTPSASGAALGKKRVADEDLTQYGFSGHDEYGVRVIYSDSKVTKPKREYLATKTADNLSSTIYGAMVPAVCEYVDGNVWSVEGLDELASTPSTDLLSFSRAGVYLLYGRDPVTGELIIYVGSTGCLLYRFESHITEVMKGLSGRPFEKKKFYQWCVDHKVIPKCVIVMFDDTEDNEPHFNEVAEAVIMSIFGGFEIDRSLALGWQAYNANAARHKSLPDVPWAGGNASWPVLMGHATKWPGHQDFHEKQCSECEFKCFKEPTMAAHQYLEHRIKRYECPFCDEAYHNASEAKEHVRVNHPKAWICEEPDCGKSFDQPTYLKNHKETHNPDRPRFPCTFPGCTQDFTRSADMRLHLKTHDPSNRVACTFPGCTQTFAYSKDMKKHLKTHDPSNRVACTFPGCTRDFAYSKDMEVHLKTHDPSNRFACTFPGCTKTFSQKGSMEVHLITHDPSNRFACTFPGCTKTFSEKGNMEAHLKTHDPSNRFACTFPGCTKDFAYSKDMKVHLKTHGASKNRVACTFPGCTQTFSDKGNMNRHVKKQHPASS